MVEMYGIIYCITNTVNGAQYVGQTTYALKVRWRHHLRCARQVHGGALQNAIRKYGHAVFKIEQMDSAKSQEDLNEKEIYWIAQLNTLAPRGYNLTGGGDSFIPSEETRQKLSKASLCHLVSEETRKRISDAKMGHETLEETRRKISKANSNISDETRRKQSESALFRPAISEETRRKHSETSIKREAVKRERRLSRCEK